MSKAQKYITRPVTVEALQFVLGETTKGDILEFCPTANVGVDGDVRWVEVDTGTEVLRLGDTNWLVKVGEEKWEKWFAEEFEERFTPETTDYAEVYEDAAGEWRFRVFAANHEQIGPSEEGFASKHNARRALARRRPDITIVREATTGG